MRFGISMTLAIGLATTGCTYSLSPIAQRENVVACDCLVGDWIQRDSPSPSTLSIGKQHSEPYSYLAIATTGRARQSQVLLKSVMIDGLQILQAENVETHVCDLHAYTFMLLDATQDRLSIRPFAVTNEVLKKTPLPFLLIGEKKTMTCSSEQLSQLIATHREDVFLKAETVYQRVTE